MLKLDGLMVAQVTPFTRGGGAVDLDWIPQHLEWLRNFSVNAILTLGTNGEGPSVSLAERRQVVEAVVREKGMFGVVAGAGCVSLPETIRAANEALEAGADAVALLPPYFFKNVEHAGLLDYFASVVEALPAQARVLLYNIPVHTGLDIPDEVVLALLELHADRVVGIKDSSGDAARTARYLAIAEEFPEFQVLAGADQAHAELYAAGCVGGVTGMGNAVPALVNAIRYAREAGNDMGRPQRQLNELRGVLNGFPAVGALKQLVAFTSGLPCPFVRAPHRDLSEDEVHALEQAVGRYLAGEQA